MKTVKIAAPSKEVRHVLYHVKRHIDKHIKSSDNYATRPYTHIVVYSAANSVESHTNWLYEENIQDAIVYLKAHPKISDFVIYALGEQVTLVNKVLK